MTFSSSELLMTLLLGTAVIFVLIFAIKRLFSSQSQRLASKLEGEFTSKTIKKLPEVDAFRFNNTFFRVGLMCSLGFALVVFNWTTFNKTSHEFISFEEDFMSMNEPPMLNPPATLPPPPPPVIDEVEDEFADDDINALDFFKTEFEIDPIKISEGNDNSKVKKIELKKEVEDNAIEEPAFFVRVEKMPAFPGCEHIEDEDEKRICTEQKLFQHVYKNLDYPTIARENSIQGMVIISFMVDKNGAITDVGVVKDIGAGCGEAAANAIKTMNDLPQNWKPGFQRTKPVNVKYNIPIKFRLN